MTACSPEMGLRPPGWKSLLYGKRNVGFVTEVAGRALVAGHVRWRSVTGAGGSRSP